MRAGLRDKLVGLANATRTTPDSDGMYSDLSPATVWASIEPLTPQNTDRLVTSLVTMPYHSGVSVDTRITYGTRELFVKGVQHVSERGVELRLLCEEVLP